MLQRLRQFSLFCVAALAFSSVAHADLTPPDQLVKQIEQDTRAYVDQDAALKKGDTSKLIAWAEKSVLNNFDFSRMTSLAVGKDWRQASADQKTQLTQQFRRLLIRTFANAFTGITKDQSIDYKPFKMAPDATDAVVKTLLIKPGTKPVDVNFSLTKGSDGWKVYDITLAGVSLITNYRESFAQEIRANGIDGLIKMLADKNRQLEQKPKAS